MREYWREAVVYALVSALFAAACVLVVRHKTAEPTSPNQRSSVQHPAASGVSPPTESSAQEQGRAPQPDASVAGDSTDAGSGLTTKCLGLARAWERASLGHELGGDPRASEASRVAELFLVWAVIRNNHTPERLMDNLCAVYPLLSPELRQNQSLSEWVGGRLGQIPVEPFPTKLSVDDVDLKFRELVRGAHVLSARFTLTASDVGRRSYLMRLTKDGGVWRVATWAPLRSQSYAPGGANAVPPQPR